MTAPTTTPKASARVYYPLVDGVPPGWTWDGTHHNSASRNL